MPGPILLGDLGGTHCRFALLGDDGKPAQAIAYDDDDFAGVAEVIAHYLAEIGAKPSELVLAAAAPVTGAEIALTNRDWRFRPDDLKARFGLARVRAINDFEAQAWALPLLEPATRSPSAGPPARRMARCVCSAPERVSASPPWCRPRSGWFAVSSEAGHISFGPASAEEEQGLCPRARDRTGERRNLALGPRPGTPACGAAPGCRRERRRRS